MSASVHRIFMAEQFAMYTEEFHPNIPLDVFNLYKKEVMEICKLSGYCGIWHPFGCSDLNTRKDMNRTVYCYIDNNNNANVVVDTNTN